MLTLKDNIRKEEMPSSTLLKGFGYALWHLSGRLGQLSDKLPVCTGKEEYEDNVDEQEEEISGVIELGNGVF